MLSVAEKNQFAQDGFLMINQFMTHDECDILIKKAQQLINDFEPSDYKTIFSTTDQQHAKHQYFLESGDKIHFFFEKNAFNSAGQLCKEKALAINKIGHALHAHDPIFNHFSRQPHIANLVSEVGIVDPLIVQSMYICKQPYIGDEVTCHQDSTYLYVEPKPVLGLWFALEDATKENGCLWAIPGAHRGVLKSRAIRNQHDQIHTEIYDDTPWNLNDMQALEVARGSVILLHGHTPHMSQANISSKSRHAYTLHVISGESHYPKDNWLQRSAKNSFIGFFAS
jgi:phytanoyl-CoA hydroxylase